MSPETQCALFDEILKIAEGTGDLMNPAVVANSATVDGAPAKPFTRRKGYRRLAVQLDKEAGAFKDALQMLRDRSRLVTQKTMKHVEKLDDAYREASIKVYGKMPEPARKVVDKTNAVMADPDQTGSAAAGEALKRLAGR